MDCSRLFNHLKNLYRENRLIKAQHLHSNSEYNTIVLRNENTIKVIKNVYNILFDIINNYSSQDSLEIPKPMVVPLNISGLHSQNGFIYLDHENRYKLKQQYSHLAFSLSFIGLKSVNFYVLDEIYNDKSHPLHNFALQFYQNNDTLLVFETDISDGLILALNKSI